jgi:multisubunit Na+/H+ antiporter MnhB subunit
MMGRPDDAITTSITTAVVMVVAAIGPNEAWRQPVLRLIDTAVGVGVGVIAAWIAGRFKPL